MEPVEPNDNRDEIRLADIIKPLVGRGRLIAQGTLLAILATALGTGVWYFWQPTRWSAWMEIAPVFQGAEDSKYPNGLAFSSSDLIAPSVIEAVYQKNDIKAYCSLDAFRSGYVVEITSAVLQMLTADYTARIADTRIAQTERQRLQDEYEAKRQAASKQYRLTFVRSDACRTLPPTVAFKALTEVLETWATESVDRRGVLKVPTAMLTPAIVDYVTALEPPLLVRAELVRLAVVRLISNIMEVEEQPGAQLISLPRTGSTLRQIRFRLSDIVQSMIDPLVAGMAPFPPDAEQWIQASLQRAVADLKAAEDKANAYRSALREYSGRAAPAADGQAFATPSQNSRDAQPLTPQIDGTFVDRLIQMSSMSSENVIFRQDLTRELVRASLEVSTRGILAAHYRQLLSTNARPAGPTTSAATEQRLTAIAALVKDLTKEFEELYAEFSRVSLRAGSSLYRVESPIVSQQLRAFGPRDAGLAILVAMIAAPLAMCVIILGMFFWRRLLQSASVSRR
jgi:hypothetical protein